MQNKNLHIITIFLFILSCLSVGKKQFEKFKDEINSKKENKYFNEFSNEYSSVIKDSLFKSEIHLAIIDDFDNKIYIKNIIANPDKDSLYVITIKESLYEKVHFSVDSNVEGKCFVYSVVGVPIKIKNSKLHFKVDDINTFKIINNCGIDKNIDIEALSKIYSNYVFDALKKTDEIEFPENSGVLFLKKLYNQYYETK